MKLKILFSKVLEEPVYFLKFLRKRCSYIFFKKTENPPPPKTISIVPTYKCDFSCIMCGNPKIFDTELDDNKVDMETYKKLLDQIAKYTPNIVLTGGEPLMYKNWYELAKYIKEKNLRLDLQTNGWMLEKEAEKIVDVVDNLNVSIDGIKEIHNRIRKKNSFEKTINGLKKIQQIKNKSKKKKPYIIIIYTITEINYEYLLETAEYLNTLNIALDTILFMHPMFIRENLKEEYLKKFGNIFKMSEVFSGFIYIPEKIEIEKLFLQIKKIKKISRRVPFDINFFPDLKRDDIEIYYENSDKFPSVAPSICNIPFTDAFILPDGNVWVCPLNIVGNIKEEDFFSLWKNEKARKFRREILKEGRFKICKNCCGLYAKI